MRLVRGGAGGGSLAACSSLIRLRLPAGVHKCSCRVVWLSCVVLRAPVTFMLHGVVCCGFTFCFIIKAFIIIYFKVWRCYSLMVMWIKCFMCVKLQVTAEEFLVVCSLLLDPSVDNSWVQLKYTFLHLKGLKKGSSTLGQNSAQGKRTHLSLKMHNWKHEWFKHNFSSFQEPACGSQKVVSWETAGNMVITSSKKGL